MSSEQLVNSSIQPQGSPYSKYIWEWKCIYYDGKCMFSKTPSNTKMEIFCGPLPDIQQNETIIPTVQKKCIQDTSSLEGPRIGCSIGHRNLSALTMSAPPHSLGQRKYTAPFFHELTGRSISANTSLSCSKQSLCKIKI